MPLPDLLRAVPREFPRLASVYAVQVQHHPALAAYATLPHLLEELRPACRGGSPERKALITLIVRAHQSRPHPVWATILLHVFTPLLKKIRKGLVGGDEDTRDEILLEEVQHALLRMRSSDPTRIFMYFRQALCRRVFEALAKVTAWEEVGFGDEADETPDPATLLGPPLLRMWARKATPERVELLGTLLDPGALQALVRARIPEGAEVERARLYQSLRRARLRLVTQLRTHVEPVHS